MEADVKDMLRKLAPVIGKQKTDKLYRQYMLDDRKGREEIESIIKGLYMQKIEPSLDANKIILPPPSPYKTKGEYSIGDVDYIGWNAGDFGLDDADLLKHIGIIGSTGSGKSITIGRIVKQVCLKTDIPVIIFDWKQTHRTLLSDIEIKDEFSVYTLGNSKTAPFKLNPLIPPPGAHPEEYAKQLVDIIAKAFYVGEGVISILNTCLLELYKEYGILQGIEEEYPTFKHVYKWIKDASEDPKYKKRTKTDWFKSTFRVVEALASGELGKMLDCQECPEKILDKRTIFELDALSSNQKSFFIDYFNWWMYHSFMQKTSSGELPQNKPNILVVLEEAHNLIHKDEHSAESVSEKLLRMGRSLGMCFIVADQMPSTLSNVFPANVNTLICLRLKFRKDMNYASDFLHIDEKHFLGNLEVGQAIVKKKTLSPFLSKITPFANKTENITDEEIRRRYRIFCKNSGFSSENEKKRNQKQPLIPSDKREGWNYQNMLLIDIMKNKYCSMTNHIKRLGISVRKAKNARDELEKNNLIRISELAANRTGRKKMILQLTRKGVEKLHEMGFEVEYDTLQEGIEHKNAKFKAVKALFQTGRFKEVRIEAELSNGHFADLLAVDSAGNRFSVEIETGRSNWKKNIDKCISAEVPVVSLLVADFKKGDVIKKYVEGKEARVVLCKGSGWLR
ncbi:DUF87 domain-containing protein [Candidatus Woesearchaeota archaeon]|nr:DUF87 domain-containing protein [Candidatus Woesearchaeota archaeon]